MENLKKRYWETIRKTRSSGRISPSVIEKTEKKWEQFDKETVREALDIHISRYPGYKENYTLGIMRNLQREKQAGAKPAARRNSFNNFPQRDYDYAELERRLLAR